MSQIKVHNFRKFAEESELNFTFPLTGIDDGGFQNADMLKEKEFKAKYEK